MRKKTNHKIYDYYYHNNKQYALMCTISVLAVFNLLIISILRHNYKYQEEFIN